LGPTTVKPHRVLAAIADAFGFGRIGGRSEQTGVGGDDEGAVGGIDAESVYVVRTRLIGTAGGRLEVRR
jgi:hypothetical protein